jgi:hypothetical protein
MICNPNGFAGCFVVWSDRTAVWIATAIAYPGRNSLIKKMITVFPRWEWTQSWTLSCSLAS